jgi:hypothetical protein
MDLDRARVARWLIEKLLTSYIISIIIIYGPIIGFNIQKSGLGTTYTVITSVTLMISIIANILVPQDFGFKERFNQIFKSQENEESDV